MWLEWRRMFGVNLGVMRLLIVAPNVVQTKGGYPFGYYGLTLLMVVNGVALGTNSFPISRGGNIPPTLAFFGNSALYEISAFVLAAATASIAKYRIVGKLPKQTIEAIVPPQAKFVIQERYVGLFLTTAILWMGS